MAVKCTNTSDLLHMEASNGSNCSEFKCHISVKPLKLKLKICAVVPQWRQKTPFLPVLCWSPPVTPSLAASHSQAQVLLTPLSSQSYATCARPKDVIKTLIYSWLQQLEKVANKFLKKFFIKYSKFQSSRFFACTIRRFVQFIHFARWLHAWELIWKWPNHQNFKGKACWCALLTSLQVSSDAEMNQESHLNSQICGSTYIFLLLCVLVLVFHCCSGVLYVLVFLQMSCF